MASRRGPDNSVRVSISGTNQAQNWANIFHCQLATSGSIAQADLDTWTTSFANAYKARFGARQVANVAYVLAKTICYTPGGGELISAIAMSGNGTSGGTAVLDNALSKVVSWLTTVYWRGGKPRSYIAGCATSELANGFELTAGEITALGTAGANFRTDVNAFTAGTITGTQFGFVSFNSGNAARPTPLFFPITGAKVHPRLGTQRRRLGKWLN
jgi:hypothetical protein